MATAAAKAQDWWLAARYWAAVQSADNIIGSLARGLQPTREALNAIAAIDMSAATGSAKTDAQEDFHLAQLCVFATSFDAEGDLEKRLDEVQQVLATRAAARDPLLSGQLRLVSECLPAARRGEMVELGKGTLSAMSFLLDTHREHPELDVRNKCLLATFNFGFYFDNILLAADFSWDAVFGVGGATLMKAVESYESLGVETSHNFLANLMLDDWIISFGVTIFPLMIHWGDIKQANLNFDRALVNAQRLADTEGQGGVPNLPTFCWLIVWAHLGWSTRMSSDRQAAFAAFMSAGEGWLTWDSIDTTVDEVCSPEPFIRPLGERSLGLWFHSQEFFSWQIKCTLVLLGAANPGREQQLGLPKEREAILSALPPVDELIPACITSEAAGCLGHGTHIYFNVFLSCAAVAEIMGDHAAQLQYALAGIDPDPRRAGTILPVSRVELLCMQGRAYAALGQAGKAIAAFEASAAEAHRHELWLYEAFALSDMISLVLNNQGDDENGTAEGGGGPLATSSMSIGSSGPSGRRRPAVGAAAPAAAAAGVAAAREHASGRLGVVLRQLTGPAEMLTPMLPGGLDAAELMRLPPPATAAASSYDYAMHYPDADTGRAVSDSSVEPADGAAKKAVEQAEPTADQRALRTELSGLKLKALKARARSLGVDEEELADADDADDVRAAVVELALAAATTATDRALEALRQELEGMKLTALQRRAASEGVEETQIENAMDGDAPKKDIIALLLHHQYLE
jgi:hypothetical protein